MKENSIVGHSDIFVFITRKFSSTLRSSLSRLRLLRLRGTFSSCPSYSNTCRTQNALCCRQPLSLFELFNNLYIVNDNRKLEETKYLDLLLVM